MLGGGSVFAGRELLFARFFAAMGSQFQVFRRPWSVAPFSRALIELRTSALGEAPNR
jgi:hypothetical protein